MVSRFYLGFSDHSFRLIDERFTKTVWRQRIFKRIFLAEEISMILKYTIAFSLLSSTELTEFYNLLMLFQNHGSISHRGFIYNLILISFFKMN